MPRDRVGHLWVLHTKSVPRNGLRERRDLERDADEPRSLLPRRAIVPREILLLAVFFGVSLSRFFGVISGMDGMTACGVSMMCRFLVMPTVVMLRCFLVVSGSL